MYLLSNPGRELILKPRGAWQGAVGSQRASFRKVTSIKYEDTQHLCFVTDCGCSACAFSCPHESVSCTLQK